MPRTKGYVAIMAVLTLMVFSLSLLLSLPLLSISGAKEALLLFESERILGALEGCVEDVLLKGVRDETYEGETRDYFGVRCESVIQKEGEMWAFSFRSTGEGVVRTLEISARRLPGSPGALTLESWLER